LTTPTTDAEKLKTARDDILFDIYMYEKELSLSSLKSEDILIIKEKIANAEELFKTVK